MAQSPKKQMPAYRIVIGIIAGVFIGILVAFAVSEGYHCISDVWSSLLPLSIASLIVGYIIGGKYAAISALILAGLLLLLLTPLFFICIL